MRDMSFRELLIARTLFILPLTVCLAIFPLLYGAPGTRDVPGFITWGNNIRYFGVLDGYALDQGPYPPFILHLFAMSFANPFLSELSVYKILSITSLAVVFIFYRFAFNTKTALLALLILYVPTLGLGYVDVYFIIPLAASLELLRRDRIVASSQFFLIAVMCKFTPLMCAPFLVFFALTRFVSFSYIKRILVIWLVIVEIALMSYVYGFQTLFENLKLALMNAYASGNALNVGWLITWLFPDVSAVPQGQLVGSDIERIYLDVHGFVYISMRISYYFIFALIAYSYLRSQRKFGNLVVSLTASILAYVTFSPGVHENHILLLTPFLMYIVNYRLLSKWHVWSLLLFTNINMLVFYGFTGSQSLRYIFGFADLSGYLAVIQTLYFCYLMVFMIKTNFKRIEITTFQS